MIFIKHKFIYLHVQKTGGNSISSALLPFSDDQKTIKKHQNGKDRFGVEGSITPRKHAWLQEYHDALGEKIDDYDVVTSVRDPLDRAISMYFSPHRWYRRDKKEWIKVDPFWDYDRFDEIVSNMYRVVDFLKIDNSIRKPNHIIRFENIQSDFASLVKKYELPIEVSLLPHVNKSVADDDLRAEALNNTKVQDLVKSRFKEDYTLLDSVADSYPPLLSQKVA